jgi:hypothetical protein
MSAEESLSSKILTNVPFIAEIYTLVTDAADRALKDKFVTSVSKDVNIVRAGIPDVNRYTAKCRGAFQKINRNVNNSNKCIKTNSYLIEYDKNDIMIVGGAALNIYDYLLKEFKNRRGIAAMEEYIKKKTSDIDIVWWPKLTATIKNPKVPIQNEIVVSSSQAIENLVSKFREELVLEFKKNSVKQNLLNQIKPYLGNTESNKSNNVSGNTESNKSNNVNGNNVNSNKASANTDSLVIKVNWLPFYAAGVHKVEVEFYIGGQVLKMLDISIHDSGASQKFDKEGKLITDLRPMTDDPVYCTQDPSEKNSIKSFIIDSKNGRNMIVRVPSIYSFIQQQMFAFDNLVRDKQQKAFINYKRVEFIKLLLEKWQNENKDDLNIIGDSISDVLKDIQNRQSYSTSYFGSSIIEVCKDIVLNKDDKYVEKLCNKVTAEQIRKNIINELNIIHKQFDNTYNLVKSMGKKKEKRTMFDIRHNIENLISEYRKENTEEILEFSRTYGSIYRTPEIMDYLEQEDRVLKAIGKGRKSESNSMPLLETPKLENKSTNNTKQNSMPLTNNMAKRSMRHTIPPLEFDSVLVARTPDGTGIFKSYDRIYWYNDPNTRFLKRRNPLTNEYEFPAKRHPSNGLEIKVSPKGIKYIENKETRQTARINPYTGEWEKMPYGLEDLFVPFEPLTSPQNILYIIDTQNKMLFRLNPYTHKWEQIPYGAPLTYGLPPPPPQSYSMRPSGYSMAPHSYSMAPQSYSMAPSGYSMAPQSYSMAPQSYSMGPQSYSMAPSINFASTGRFGYNRRNRTSKKRNRNINNTMKR